MVSKSKYLPVKSYLRYNHVYNDNHDNDQVHWTQ